MSQFTSEVTGTALRVYRDGVIYVTEPVPADVAARVALYAQVDEIWESLQSLVGETGGLG